MAPSQYIVGQSGCFLVLLYASQSQRGNSINIICGTGSNKLPQTKYNISSIEIL